MSAAHTPGKLSFRPALDGSGDLAISTDAVRYPENGKPGSGLGVMIAECFSDIRFQGEHNVAECAANARRLSACWNACDGLTTDMLEQAAFVVPARVRMADLTAQRDALLKAAEALSKLSDTIYIRPSSDEASALCEAWKVMDAAIAKAEGRS